MKRPSLPPGVQRGLRIGVSVTLMAALLTKVDPGQILHQWKNVPWGSVISLVVVIHVICLALKTVRHKTILESLGIRVPLWWLGLTQLKSFFLIAVLPGSVGGDAYRAYAVAKNTGHTIGSLSAVIIEKVAGLASMFIVSGASVIYGALWLAHPVHRQMLNPLLAAACITAAGGLLLVWAVRAGRLGRLGAWAKTPFVSKLPQKEIFSFSRSWGALAWIISVSVLLQITVVTWYFFVSKAVGWDLSILGFLVAIPVVELLVMLPISVGGIGVREGTFVVLFAPLGVTVEDAISFSLLCFTLATSMRVLSGLAFAITSNNSRPMKRDLEEKPAA